MKNKIFKNRCISMLMATVFTLMSVIDYGGSSYTPVKAETVLPTPAYQWNFEPTSVSGSEVSNLGTAASGSAIMMANASVQNDMTINSNVLNLPGGTVKQGGYLTLPEGLFQDSADGFTLSMLINESADNDSYARVFESSIYDLGTGSAYGHTSWQYSDVAMEFNVADDAAASWHTQFYFKQNATNDSGLRYAGTQDKLLTADRWQLVTYVLSKTDGLSIYVNGEKCTNEQKYLQTNMGVAATWTDLLNQFFDTDRTAFKYSAIGLSIYGDNDLKAKLDDVRFYNQAMTETEISSLVDDYNSTVDTTTLNSLIASAQAELTGNYTAGSLQTLVDAIAAAQKVAACPISAQYAAEQVTNLQSAINGLQSADTAVTVPDPIISYDFNSATGTTVSNAIQPGTSDLTLQGTADLVDDSVLGSKVLELKGGSNGSSWAQLPDNLYQNINGTDGFSVSFWLKPNGASIYSHIFVSTNIGFNHTTTTGWSDPALYLNGEGKTDIRSGVLGGTVVGGSYYTTKGSTLFSSHDGEWQQVILTFKNNSYKFYVNGVDVSPTSDLSAALSGLFADGYLDTLINNGLGRSVYNDADYKGYIDDFKFYNTALTVDQVAEIKAGYTTDIDTSALTAKITEANGYLANIGDYTVVTTDALQEAVTAAQKVLALPINTANVATALSNLTAAVGNLVPSSGVVVPDPAYEWTFDDGLVAGDTTKIANKQDTSDSADYATLKGSAQIAYSDERVSEVLELPGGSNGSGSLTLPENLYSQVTDGFAVSLWVKPDSSANNYSRIFESSNVPLGATYDGIMGGWTDTEFTFVVGGDTGSWGYNSAILLGTAGQAADTLCRLKWNSAFTRGTWQHVIISVSANNYIVYIDGKKVTSSVNSIYNGATLETALTKFFGTEYLAGMKYNSIGQSVYTSDGDLKGEIDEVRFYNTVIDADQALAIYNSYDVDATLLTGLQDKITEVKAYHASYYTKDSYNELLTAVRNGETVYAKPLTDAAVQKAIDDINTAISNLAYYKDTYLGDGVIDNRQLIDETASAILTDTGNYDPSVVSLFNQAITNAQEIISKGNTATQEEIDSALVALREALNNIYYDGATLHVDMTDTSTLNHTATGFLYGLSEPNIPSIDLTESLLPSVFVQKALDGEQHPTGDGVRLESMADETGATNIQIYLQDAYREWPYEAVGTLDEVIDNYCDRVIANLKEMQEITGDPHLSKYSFVLFNEPDGIWFNSNSTGLFAAYKKLWNRIKTEVDPEIKCVGPNVSGYSDGWVIEFIKYSAENNCPVDILSWHELAGGNPVADYRSHYAAVKAALEQYYTPKGYEIPDIIVNEYAMYDDVGTAGSLIPWVAMFEETGIYSCLAYWGLANTLNESAADANKPSSAWWLLKWYADMTGERAKVTQGDNCTTGGTYAISSIDNANKTAYLIFGGQDGTQTAYLDNLNDTAAFKNATSAHVKLYGVSHSGQQGFADQVTTVYEGNMKLNDAGALRVAAYGCNELDAYYAVVTPATNDAVTTYSGYDKVWKATYEAENGTLLGNATAQDTTNVWNLKRSNDGDVVNINTTDSGVTFHVNAPETGKYQLRVYYSNTAPNVDASTLVLKSSGQNRGIGQKVTQSLSVNGVATEDLVYDSTIKTYYNYVTKTVNLTAGDNSITIKHKSSATGNISASLDKIELTAMEASVATPQANIEFEENLRRNTAQFSFDNSTTGFSGGGYVTGSGDYTFTVVVPEDGLYDTSLIYKNTGNSVVIKKQAVDYASSAATPSTTDSSVISTRNITVAALSGSNTSWVAKNCGQIYLTAGANIFTVSGDGLSLDKLSFVKNSSVTSSSTIKVEAEDAQLNGTADSVSAYYYNGNKITDITSASNGQVVDGLTVGAVGSEVTDPTTNNITLKVTAAKAGDYKLSMFYSNDEPAPVMESITNPGAIYVHPYNSDLVERYAQVKVNAADPETIYFRNTFCWDTIRNVVMDISLQQGENTIVIYNDNSYHISSMVNAAAPLFDKFEITPATTFDLSAATPTDTPTSTVTPTPTSTPAPTTSPSTPTNNPSNTVTITPTVTPTVTPSVTPVIEKIEGSANQVPVTLESTKSEEKLQIKVKIAEEKALDLLNALSGTNSSAVDIPIVSDRLIQQVSEGNLSQVDIALDLADTILDNKSIDKLNIKVPAELLEKAAAANTDVNVAVSDESGKEIYSWNFDGGNLANSNKKVTDVNLTLTVEKVTDNNDVKELLAGEKNQNNINNGILIRFSHEGVLPAQALVRIYVGDIVKQSKGNRVYVYYYNSVTDKLETLPYSSSYEVGADGYITFNLIHCSDYVFLPNAVDQSVMTSLTGQIKVTPGKKTLYVGGTTNTSTSITIQLPSTLELMAALRDKTSSSAIGAVVASYKSSNDKVASVDATGRITAKGTGTATISTTITLYNGKHKTFVTKITVKKPYITVVKSADTMKTGENFTFNAKAYGLDISKAVWSSSDSTVIKIDKKTGKATAKAKGTAYIKVTIGDVTKKIKVTVK